jgi:hypothetical protein
MIVELRTADYLRTVIAEIEAGHGLVPITSVCPECGEDQNDPAYQHYVSDGNPHMVARIADRVAVVIGCEGYWLYDTEDGVVTLRPLDNALGDEVTGVHDADCTGIHTAT